MILFQLTEFCVTGVSRRIFNKNSQTGIFIAFKNKMCYNGNNITGGVLYGSKKRIS